MWGSHLATLPSPLATPVLQVSKKPGASRQLSPGQMPPSLLPVFFQPSSLHQELLGFPLKHETSYSLAHSVGTHNQKNRVCKPSGCMATQSQHGLWQGGHWCWQRPLTVLVPRHLLPIQACISLVSCSCCPFRLLQQKIPVSLFLPLQEMIWQLLPVCQLWQATPGRMAPPLRHIWAHLERLCMPMMWCVSGFAVSKMLPGCL